MKGSLKQQKTKKVLARRWTGKFPCWGFVGAEGNVILFNSVKCLNEVIAGMIERSHQWNSKQLFNPVHLWDLSQVSEVENIDSLNLSGQFLAACILPFCRMTFEKLHFYKISPSWYLNSVCQTLSVSLDKGNHFEAQVKADMQADSVMRHFYTGQWSVCLLIFDFFFPVINVKFVLGVLSIVSVSLRGIDMD